MKFIFGLLAVFIISSVSFAQSVSLRGQVTDQNGAVIPKAKVTLDGPPGLVKTVATDDRGGYSFTELPPGDYSVTASAPNLALMEPAKITLKSGVQTLNLQLSVVIAEQNVNVQENTAPAVTTDSSNNASAVVLRGDDLKSLGDSAEDLQADLLALAGPSAGPGVCVFFIHRSRGATLLPYASLRELGVKYIPAPPE